jgi:hypothetical protein
MALNVNFRVVGVFCYLPNLSFPTLSPQSTVKQVMDEIKTTNPDFTYDAGHTKPVVDRIQYRFGNNSIIPPNSLRSSPGTRDIETNIGPTSMVLQFYRSVTGKIDGVPVELFITPKGQPSYATTALNADLVTPPSFQPEAFNLTWRLVQIQLDDESRTGFLTAKMEARNSRFRK